MVILAQLINGLATGGVYALVAAGIAMIFGVSELVNWAHGEFLMAASYLFFALYVLARLPYAIAGAFTVLLMLAFGAVFETLVIRPIVHRPWQTQLVATLGASIFLINTAIVVFGTFPRRATTPLAMQNLVVGSFSISYQRLLLIGLTLFAFLVLHLFIHRAKLGKAMRAVSQNRDACIAVGIDIQMIVLTAFAIGGSLVGLAAILYAPLGNITPFMGIPLTFKAFAVVIMGGFGSVNGAVASAFILGVVEAFTIQFISSAYVDAMSFLIMLTVLVWRPYGLFGRKVGI